jgi:hypothetical protein
MDLLKPSGNGLYLLQHSTATGKLPSIVRTPLVNSEVALTAECDYVLWHKWFRHLNMQILHAQNASGDPTSHALPSSVKNVSCGSCLLNKANAAPRNTQACAKSPRPLMNLSSDIWGPVNVLSPHGLHYCVLVIDHHTNYMWVRFLKSKDDTCSELESILLEVRHMHARYHSAYGTFSPVLKFDSNSVFEATATRQMCGRLGVGIQFSSPQNVSYRH